MNDYRIVMVSTESDYHFIIYRKAINEHEAVVAANKEHAPHFQTTRQDVTEVM